MFICLILFNGKYLKTTLIYLIIQIKPVHKFLNFRLQ